MKSIITRTILFFFFIQTSAYGMTSTNYSISSLNSNYGSGSRVSENYQISSDAVSQQGTGSFSSSNYSILGLGLSSIDELEFMAGVYIDSDSKNTDSTSVILNLICSAESGCTEVMISNNGVSWSDPIPYSTSIAWDLISNDGSRSVFVKFKNGDGEWSGVTSDFIELDTTPPTVTISPVSGTFMENPSIALTASEPAIIYYTTDGIDPTIDSAVYSGPISLASDTVLKCFAIDLIGNTGPIASDSYTVCSGSNLSITGAVKDSTVDKGLPLAVITLDSGHTTPTDIDGNYSFTGLPRGYYKIESITAIQPGYVTYQKGLELCQANISHDIIMTQESTVFGGDTFAGYSSGSVNTGTGNFTYGYSDLGIPGKGISFVFERSYNSLDESDGPLGYGWTHNYNISLSEGSEGAVTVRRGDGKAQTWIPDGSDGYTPMQGVFDTLIKNLDNTYTIQQKDLIQYNFNTLNKLASIEDDNGNALTFTYSGDTVDIVTDTSGRIVQFSYDAEDRITRILDLMGRSVTFTYDVNGNLTSSTDTGGNTTSYIYNATHQILTITDPLGNKVITNVYDDQRRAVASQLDALGAETLYSYNTTNKVTQIVDPLGNASYHHYDDLLRLIQEVDAKGHSAYYVYNELGHIEKAIDKNGNETSYQYDEHGNTITKTNPFGNPSTATYDSNDNPLSKTDKNGNSTLYTYIDSNLETVEDSLGHITAYTYDIDGQMLSKTNALLKTTSFEYDQYGNMVAVTDAMSNRSTFNYDIVGRKLSETHPLGRATAYEYDNIDHLISVSDALGGVSTFVYDANGNKTEHTEASGNKSSFVYDAKNRLISITNPLGKVETYTYDMLDRKISVTNHNGFTSFLGYDEIGNIIHETDALQNQIRHEYDPNGNKTTTIDAMGNRTTFVYDQLNRLTSTTDALGNTTTHTYDKNGNRLTVTDALGHTAESSYDQMNRVKTIKDPLLNTITNDYDELGRVVKVADPESNETAFEYDDLGRLVKVTDAASGKVQAVYDAIGNRISMIDPRGFSTTYEYDILNRLLKETDPLSNTSSVTYDAIGNVLSTSDSNGTTYYSYDNINRLTSLTYPDSTTAAYTYDANGNRLTVTDIMGVTSYEYDKLDRIISVIDPFNMTVGYTYNSNGNRTSTVYPGDKAVSYLYDRLNRLVLVQDWEGKSTQYQYDNISRLTDQLMANGSTTTYSYDIAGRLTDKVDRDPYNAVISSYSYTLDKIGNRTGLEMEQPLLPRIDYTNNSFSHNDGSQVVSGNGSTFGYDGKGNRTDKTKDSVFTQYSYNYDDLLTRRQHGTDIDEYNYNSDGHRLSSTINSVETRYLLDSNNGMEIILAEIDENNDIKTYYIHGDGLVYSIDATTGKRLYYHYDPLGSTIALSDELGNITDKYAYLPYGELTANESVNENPFTYVGKYGVMLEENGLYFMRARFYDPVTKMFISKDLVKGDMNNSQTMSPYVYANSNPMTYVDPDGELAVVATVALAYLAYRAGIGIANLAIAAHEANEGTGSEATLFRSAGGSVAGLITQNPFIGIASSAVKGSKNAANGENRGKCHLDDWCHATYAGAKLSMTINNKILGAVQSFLDNRTLPGGMITTAFPYQEVAILNIPTKYAVKRNTRKYSLSPFQKKSPKKYLSSSYAKHVFNKEFAKLKDPDLLDNRTRSYIEMRISNELWSLQSKQYGYRTKKQKKEAKAQRTADTAAGVKRLYANLTKSLSKYSVLVQSLDKLPDFNSGNLNRGGVYAK